MRVLYEDLYYLGGLTGRRYTFFLRNEREFLKTDEALLLVVDTGDFEVSRYILNKAQERWYNNVSQGKNLALKKCDDGTLRVRESEKFNKEIIEVFSISQAEDVLVRLIQSENVYKKRYNYCKTNFRKICTQIAQRLKNANYITDSSKVTISEKNLRLDIELDATKYSIGEMNEISAITDSLEKSVYEEELSILQGKDRKEYTYYRVIPKIDYSYLKYYTNL